MSALKGKITKGDMVLIVCVIALAVFLFVRPFLSSDEGLRVKIYLDGEVVAEKSLSALSESEALSVGGCELLLERDGVTFLSSECEDKLCVNRGKLSMKGDSMACVPERVAVVITGEKSPTFDGISY